MKFLFSILILFSLTTAGQSVFIPESPVINSQQFTITASVDIPAGIKKIEWKVTSGTATLINSGSTTVTVQVAADGAYRFDIFVTDMNDVTVTDWVPVSVSGSALNPIPVQPPVVTPPGTIIVRDTIKIFIDTCRIDYTRINDLTFVLVLPDEGGQVRLPDSTTVYQAVYGAIPPHIRLKDSIGGIMYRFQRTYTINKVSTPIRFTMYKTGAWIRERKDSAGIWQNYPYAPY